MGASPTVLFRLFDSNTAKKKYSHHIRQQERFLEWMEESDRDTASATTMDVLNYVAPHLEDGSWKPFTARACATNLLHLFSPERSKRIREDENYKAFFKAAAARTLKRIRHYDMDMGPVYNAIREMGPNQQLNPVSLRNKVTFLLGLVGYMRPDDQFCTDVALCKIYDDRLHLTVVNPKERRGGMRITKRIIIKAHEDDLLCPVSAFKEYRARTAMYDDMARCQHPKWLDDVFLYTPLLRTLSGKQRIQVDAISKCQGVFMELMPREEGQPRPKLRAAGAALAIKKGIPVEEVTTHGNWSSPRIVEDYYRITRHQAHNFTDTILS